MRFAALLTPLFLFAASAFADDANVRTITTTGTATIYVVPDEATLQFTVHTFDAALPNAKTLNDKAADEVLSFLKSSGIEVKDIQTAAVSSSAVYEYRQEYNRQVRGPIVGYDVRREYGVKLRDLKKLGSVYDKLLPDTRVTIQNTSLSTSENRKHRDQARLDAAKAAREKADALASACNAQVGAPRQISESSPTFFGGNRMSNLNMQSVGDAGGEAVSSDDVSPVGQIEVQATVTVVYDLTPKTES